MCLIGLAFKAHPRYTLILAANRDEYFERPTADFHFWPENKNILAGKDLKENGTWLGIKKNRQFAAVTNIRMAKLQQNSSLKSRGQLLSSYLLGDITPENYLKEINPDEYNPFNLILGNGDSLIHFNGLKQKLKVLNKGVFSVSNGDLDNSWPKCQKISHEIENQLSLNDPEEIADNLFKVLLNKDIANDESLPDTGIGIDLERILSPPFIQTPLYGTRSSTVIIMGQKQAFCFNQNHQKESKIQRFEIELLC